MGYPAVEASSDMTVISLTSAIKEFHGRQGGLMSWKTIDEKQSMITSLEEFVILLIK